MITLTSFGSTVVGLIKSIWASIVHLWQPSGSSQGHANHTDINNSGISAAIIGALAFLLAHMTEFTGILTSLGLSSGNIGLIIALLTFFAQSSKKVDDKTPIEPVRLPMTSRPPLFDAPSAPKRAD